MKSSRSWFGYLSLFLILCLFLVGATALPVMACEPFPDNWFAETVTLEAEGLPVDFHLYDYNNSDPEQFAEGVWLSTDNPHVTRRATIYLLNHTETPVYIMSLEYRDRLVMVTPDENYAARVRMAHEAASYLVRPDSGEVVALEWQALVDLDHSLSDPNQPTFNTPPENATPPAAQHSELLMVYGEQVIVLPFTISYSLNQDFKADDCSPGPAGVPDPTVAPRKDQGLGTGLSIILLLAGIGLTAGIAWLVWRWRR